MSTAQPPQLGKAKTYDLVALLASVQRLAGRHAARLLFERRDPAASVLLSNMLNRSVLPLARLRALHALDGQGALSEAAILKGLRDADERVREHAVLLSKNSPPTAASRRSLAAA